MKASRRSLAEASSVNRRLARAYESLDRSLRASSSSHVDPPTTAAAESGTVAGDKAASEADSTAGGAVGSPPVPAAPPSPESSVGSFGGGSGGNGGGGGGGGGVEWQREIQGAGAGDGGAGVSGRAQSRGAGDNRLLQVRNLSTGDIDVLVPGGGEGRERASTEAETVAAEKVK